jgi:hypothetical protein
MNLSNKKFYLDFQSCLFRPTDKHDKSSMQPPTIKNSSTSSASSQSIVGEPSSQGHSAQTAASSTRGQ